MTQQGGTDGEGYIIDSIANENGGAMRQLMQSAGELINGNSSFNSSLRLNRTGGRKEVCISPCHPIVSCDPELSSSTYTGFMVKR